MAVFDTTMRHVVDGKAALPEKHAASTASLRQRSSTPSGHPQVLSLRCDLRRLALSKEVKHWLLATLREKLAKVGAKDTRYEKHVTFQLAEVVIPRKLFATILDRIKQ